MRQNLLFIACLFVSALPLKADQVTLKNGDRISGTIVKSDIKSEVKSETTPDIKADVKVLLIKTEFAGDVAVHWDAIVAIDSTQPLHLVLSDGQTIVGLVKTDGEKFEVAAKETGAISAPRSSVVTIRSDAEQIAFNEEAERLRHPHLTDFWSGLLDTGLSVTRGNSSLLNYTLAGKAVRETSRDKFTVYTAAIYGKDSGVSPTRTIAHAIHGGIRADLNFSEKMFVFGFTDFDYDALQHLDLRNVLGGGIGYHAINSTTTKFDLFAGVDFDQEYFGSYPNPALPSGIEPSITRKSAEIVVGEEFSTKLNSRTSLSERFSLFPNVSSTGNYRAQFDATASTKLKNWLGWQITFTDRYLSNPPTLLKANDLLLSTGLRLNFGKGPK